jgi:serine phosphatase RsbU (regulator of sigma subunit)
MFGDERLFADAKSCAEAPAQRCLDSILAAVSAFADGAPQSDDITVVVAKCANEVPAIPNGSAG